MTEPDQGTNGIIPSAISVFNDGTYDVLHQCLHGTDGSDFLTLIYANPVYNLASGFLKNPNTANARFDYVVNSFTNTIVCQGIVGTGAGDAVLALLIDMNNSNKLYPAVLTLNGSNPPSLQYIEANERNNIGS